MDSPAPRPSTTTSAHGSSSTGTGSGAAAAGAPAADSRWWVVCLCAQWCGTCGEYRAPFDALARSHPGVRFEWVDIEDEAELAGDLDVETFPTLLVGCGEQALFLGPLLPQGAVLGRLLASLQTAPQGADGGGAGAGAEAQAVFARVRAARQGAPS